MTNTIPVTTTATNIHRETLLATSSAWLSCCAFASVRLCGPPVSTSSVFDRNDSCVATPATASAALSASSTSVAVARPRNGRVGPATAGCGTAVGGAHAVVDDPNAPGAGGGGGGGGGAEDGTDDVGAGEGDDSGG